MSTQHGRHLSAADPYEETPPMSTPPPGVETKVKVASFASYVGGLVGLAVLNALSDGKLLAALPLPPAVTAFVAPLIPALVAFGASYIAKHTPRESGLGADVDAIVAARVAEQVAKVREELGLPPAASEVRS